MIEMRITFRTAIYLTLLEQEWELQYTTDLYGGIRKRAAYSSHNGGTTPHSQVLHSRSVLV